MAVETPADRAYENSAYIPGAEAFPNQWQAEAAAFRAATRHDGSVPYGVSQRETYDLFFPAAEPTGLVVFFHGGYWMAFDKSYWSHLAAGAVARGCAVAIPSYPLCPAATLTEIVAAAGAAVDHAADKVAGPIILTGHSAGGHLAARLACEDAPISALAAARMKRTVPISGLHDLRPLMRTTMNETLRLSDEEARRESPALCNPAEVDVVAWVGDGERPQLRRQSRLLALIWEGLASSVRYFEAPDRHHFDVIADLGAADSPLVDAIVADL